MSASSKIDAAGKNQSRIGKLGIALAVLLAAAVLFIVPRWAAHIRQEKRIQAEKDAVEEYVGPADMDVLAELEEYRNLKRADLSGSEDPEPIMAWMEKHPDVEVLYTVDVGGTTLSSQAEEAILEQDAYSLEALEEKLKFLPRLRSVTLRDLSCEPEKLTALRDRYPDRKFHYSVNILGESVDEDTQSLDLRELTPDELEKTLTRLRLLPELKTAELTGQDGGNKLALAEVSRLQNALPHVEFRYRFSLFGQEVSTEDERIEFYRVPIKNEGLETLREAIPVLTSCRYLLLDDCGIDNELLAQLRDEFPETKIVWRVHIDYLNFLTDVKVIHLTFQLTNSNAQVMRFCNEVEYLDIGHNSISDIRFVSGMPELKYFILSYNQVSDLSPLKVCKKLEMLELYFCIQLKDISPLTECGQLQLLNISATAVRDLEPVCRMENLKRFYCIMNPGLTEEQKQQVLDALPDCWITFRQEVYKNVGWSFDDTGVRAQWYLDMARILRYRVEDWFFGGFPDEGTNWT